MIRPLQNAKFLSLFAFFLALSCSLASAQIPGVDPFFWLEDIHGEPATTWVKEQNNRTKQRLEANAEFQEIYKQALDLEVSNDRVAFGSYSEGWFWNFWKDAEHPRGLVRRTTYEEYKKAQPQWETFLDIDELARIENKNWNYSGSVHLQRDGTRYLIKLSDGGKDAVTIREYNSATQQFVTDGFFIPEAKTRVVALNNNELLVATDFGEGSLTESNYPRVLKLWKRGDPLSAATLIYQASTKDLNVGATYYVDGETTFYVVKKALDFFSEEAYFFDKTNLTLRKIPIPKTSSIQKIRNGWMYVHNNREYKSATKAFAADSLVRLKTTASCFDEAELVYAPGERQTVQGLHFDGDKIYVNLLDNVVSKVIIVDTMANFQTQPVQWNLPANGMISISSRDELDPAGFMSIIYNDFLTPASQYRIQEDNGVTTLELLKSGKSRFDASAMEVHQHFATSKDGTRIPYFVVASKNLVLDGSHPTILYGYGGFSVSQAPSYLGTTGKLWLERGHVYVIGNIRGGGEYGPDWHEAALKTHRQRAFDDFAAIAEDLIARGITSPRHLAISGGSNGGLLVGTVMVQRPELFNGALIKVPLLDMYRFSQLSAGQSWTAEYGDPRNPEECNYLLAYSPYHNVKPGVQYPAPMLITSTADDRVHPSHARKMAARMSEQGHDYYYYENTNGGHAGTSTPEESAYSLALNFTYLLERLK
jgi:prolyl oligopeptidase